MRSNRGRKSGQTRDPFASLVDTALHKMEMSPVHLQQRAVGDRNKASFSPMSAIKPEDLRLAKTKLKSVTNVTLPYAPGITIARNHTAGHEFADFVTNTRRDLTVIGSTTSGQDIFKNISKTHTAKPELGVTIRDASQTESPIGLHEKSVRDNLENSMISMKPGDLMETAGPGSSGTVHHHTDKTQWGVSDVAVTSPIALGHELIHSMRGMMGMQRAPGMDEERETVGKPSGARDAFTNLPTENSLRKDLQEQHYKGGTHVSTVQKRSKYGGVDI